MIVRFHFYSVILRKVLHFETSSALALLDIKRRSFGPCAVNLQALYPAYSALPRLAALLDKAMHLKIRHGIVGHKKDRNFSCRSFRKLTGRLKREYLEQQMAILIIPAKKVKEF